MAPASASENSHGDAKGDDDRRKTEKRRRRRRHDDDADGDDEEEEERHRRGKRSRRDDNDDADSESDSSEDRRKRRKKRKERKRRKDKKRSKKDRKKKSHRKRYSSSSSSSSSDDGSSSSDRDDDTKPSSEAPSSTLLAKLQARGETLEERQARRAERAAKKRAAQIASITGYTAEENPFHDPNLHEPFTWKKKKQQAAVSSSSPPAAGATTAASKHHRSADEKTLHEIEKLRQRRTERELQMEEMERIKREESRMKELESFDEWARKEEAFHLQQQRQRSAIRLVRGREQPIDVLAKNLLLFGLTEEEKSLRGAAVKYQETNNALTELEKFSAELEEPFVILQKLKLEELQDVMKEIDAFLSLERQVLGQESSDTSTVLRYWQALRLVTLDEIKTIQTGGPQGTHATQAMEIQKIFVGQSTADLRQMQTEIQAKLRDGDDANVDKEYWRAVQDQLAVHLAKADLSAMHQKMLVRQLEKLEQKRDELAQKKKDGTLEEQEEEQEAEPAADADAIPSNAVGDEGDLEEELGLTNEVGTKAPNAYAWADKYRPRKPRYFNRVKTGYDWNKYNKTHYDRDNPPPKTVQGYKFNIFYPDLIDPSKTPQFVLEASDSPDFCIIRFRAGPPYEDVAFKIVNREWNKARKHGFRCTFERGVLSLYFNFKTSWYRR